jgi:radical SAM protein with 4Fe4S-binding SPASM domain
MKATTFDFFVQFHLTQRCNLACRHCYQSGPAPEMGSEEVRRVVTDIKTGIDGWAGDYGLDISPSLHFTGGEPLLRHDLFTMLRFARERGFSTSLMSNGTLVDGPAAREIRMAGTGDVQISLDGLEDTHDSLRGRGSYRRALAGLRRLADEGVETSINVTVSRMNMHQAGELVDAAARTGAGSIAFARLVPTGRGKELSDQALSAPEVAAFYEGLRRYRDNGAVMVTSRDPLAAVAEMKDMSADSIPQTDLPIGGCAAGLFGVTIMADGTVMPCRRMDLPIGSIRSGGFRDLWADSPELWRLRTREEYHGGCETCRYWPVCRGCRAIALAFAMANGSEDTSGPDPQCPYRQPS